MYASKIVAILASSAALVSAAPRAALENEQNVVAGETCTTNQGNGCSSDMTQIFLCVDGVWEQSNTCELPYQCPDLGGYCVVA